MDRRLLRQVALERVQQLGQPLALGCAHRDDFGELRFRRGLLQEWEQLGRTGAVYLVHGEEQRNRAGHQLQERAVFGAEAPRFHHQQRDVDLVERAAHLAVHGAGERAGMLVWKPGVSTKMNWARGVVRMPRMLCRVVCGRREVMLSFCPRSALSSVDLPDVGPPHERDRPAAERLRTHRDGLLPSA